MAATPTRTVSELQVAIRERTLWLKELKVESEIEEATEELVSLKEEFKAATGEEWSDQRETVLDRIMRIQELLGNCITSVYPENV